MKKLLVALVLLLGCATLEAGYIRATSLGYTPVTQRGVLPDGQQFTAGAAIRLKVQWSEIGNHDDKILRQILDVGAEFWAFCLEPDETIGMGRTYWFDVVDLADAPSSNIFGPMDGKGETWIERIATGFGYDSVDTVVNLGGQTLMNTFQQALYEAGPEPTDRFDPLGGGVRVTPANGGWINASVGFANDSNIDTSLVQSYGLLNHGLGASPDETYRGQDMFVYTRAVEDMPQVPEPSVALVFGLGLLGLTGVSAAHRRWMK